MVPTWQVDHIECEGCAASIRRALTSIDGVSEVISMVSCAIGKLHGDGKDR